jgi:hypothetical protein
MDGWQRIDEFPRTEQSKLRWLLRHAPDNGIVEAGVALKYGREWRINSERLPGFLMRQTIAALGERGHAA